MESVTGKLKNPSPASKALMDAVDEALAGESSFPDRAVFVDADGPYVGAEIAEAHADDRAVVLCYADGKRLVVRAALPVAAA